MTSVCRYGNSCYRKNKEHIQEFHPEKMPVKRAHREEEDENSVAGPSFKRDKDVSDDDSMEDKKDVRSNRVESDESKKKKTEQDELEVNERSEPETVRFKPYYPSFIRDLWNYCLEKNEINPREALIDFKEAKLTGIYDVYEKEEMSLTEELYWKTTGGDFVLPEADVFMSYNGGRYALWKDDLHEGPDYYIVNIKNEQQFPAYENVGTCLAHLLVHLAGNKVDSILPEGMTVDETKKEIKSIQSKRRKEALGKPHGMGIWVKVRNDVGYRPQSMSIDKIKENLVQLNSEDDWKKKKAKSHIMELMSLVNFAIDECDYGAGLELGHILFLSNVAEMESSMKKLLGIVYDLLNRSVYKRKLEARLSSLS